jgi:hypothetical protein
MALPNETRTAKTDAVEAEIKKMGPKALAWLPGIDDDDDFKGVRNAVHRLVPANIHHLED